MNFFLLGLASLLSFADVNSILKIPAAKPAENVAPLPESLTLASPEASSLKPVIAGFDVYGSSRLNATVIKQNFGTEIEQWFKLGLSADPSVTQLERKLLSTLINKYDLAFAEWSIVEHLEPPNVSIYITLDVVEKKDADRRMHFVPAPTARLSDPGGLIMLWEEYQKLGLSLVEVGELQLDSVDCESFHCPFGHKHPKLQKYEKLFMDGVKKHGPSLVEILTKDTRAESRAAAAFLLAYSRDGKQLVQYLVPAIRDSSDLVRNNVLRVLGDIAEFHPEIVIPTKVVADALEFPRVSDRSKAINIIYFLAMSSLQSRQYLSESSLATLLAMLASQQPDHRLAAHAILRKLSSKNYPATDAVAWSNWAKRAAASSGRVPSKE